MSPDTEITVFYGPLSWFSTWLNDEQPARLLALVSAQDDRRREFRVTQDGEPIVPGPEVPRPDLVVAESGDYATLNEHVITNFAEQVRSIRPQRLWLHNPPTAVHDQLNRVFGVTVERFSYPMVERTTLVEISEGFSEHLVGQRLVKDSLLTALYPLTKAGRTRPVVLMLYGPSGVGKTETARFVNELLGGKLLRKQFSMFHSEKFTSYLFGGHHSEPSFAHDLLDRESGVVLIDEFDKANPIFHSAFYELFDGGVYEDKNYRVEVGPEVIICTSNYGTERQIQAALGDALFSRFDALIEFKKLSRAEIVQIIDMTLDGRISDLSPEEAGLIDVDDVRKKLHGKADGLGNVRRLGKFVDEVVSLQLVRSLINSESQAERVNKRGPGAS